MKVLIVYFSASGNTQYGAELIQKGIDKSGNAHTCDLMRIQQFKTEQIDDYDLVGFASPVLAFKPALNVLELIEGLPQADNKPCFTFNTNGGGPLNADRIFYRKLSEKGFAVIAQKDMVCEDSWTTIRSDKRPGRSDWPTKESQEAVVEFGKGLPHAYSRFIREGFRLPEPKMKYSPLHLVSYIYGHGLLKKRFVTDVDPEKCIQCGLCVKQCPTGRMHFDAFPKPRGKCVGCYGCINICPRGAIEGWVTKGRPRYRGISQNVKIGVK